MIHRIHDMVGSSGTSVKDIDDCWYRAVPEPWPSTFMERIADAWAVLHGRAHVVAWPKAGDLEEAIKQP